jgi:hypothetical protein
MEVLPVLRSLLSRRLLVGAGLVVAIAVGLMARTTRASDTGLASTRVVLDTLDSQLVHADPKGADSLVWRAQLLSALMGSEPVRRGIARDVRVPAKDLAVVDAALATPVVATTLPVAAAQAAAAAIRPEPYVLTVQSDPQLPMVSIEARAPDSGQAARLARAAAAAIAAAAPASGGPELQRFSVEAVGPPRMRTVEAGQGRLRAVGAALAVFVLWCGCVVLCARLTASSRASGRTRTA